MTHFPLNEVSNRRKLAEQEQQTFERDHEVGVYVSRFCVRNKLTEVLVRAEDVARVDVFVEHVGVQPAELRVCHGHLFIAFLCVEVNALPLTTSKKIKLKRTTTTSTYSYRCFIQLC